MTSLFEDHLSLDAVVAFADGEMGLTAFQRAAAHVARCAACATEVAEQTSARQQLRSAACPSIPTGLLEALRSIPVALPAAPPPAGVARDAVTGRAGRTAPAGHDDAARQHATARRRGAHDTAAAHHPMPLPGPLSGRSHQQRGRGFRLGAGAIVAGLAVGAIAATAIVDRSTDPAEPAGQPDTAQVSYPDGPPAAVPADRGSR